MRDIKPGAELLVTASDPGFASDVPAWCRSNGHELVEIKQVGPNTTARIRRGLPGSGPATNARRGNKKTMVVFSGDLDKVLAAFVIANGAVSMGNAVTMFFTFWGLNALRKDAPQAAGKALLDRMFGWMMPRGVNRLKLSQMHMLGMGTAMMKHVMKSKQVDSLRDLMAQARAGGVKFVACSMSMNVMGITPEELIDGVDTGGVAAFLGESTDADMTLFI